MVYLKMLENVVENKKICPTINQEHYEDTIMVGIMIVTITELQQKKNMMVNSVLGFPQTIDE